MTAGSPGAVALAAAVATGSVSAQEVVTACLEHIAARNPQVGAVAVLDAERALLQAGRIDKARAEGRSLGPLAGVPVTVKECFARAGLDTTAGSPELAGHPATADAPAVRALRASGAVVVGKTNLSARLARMDACVNPLFGRTSNPWSRARSCGGSSGGSAAAVAAGLVPLDVGSDLSGSIRVPAAWCGVVGMRPSAGLISKRGHLPWPLEGWLEPPFSVVGPLARTVEDVTAAFEALVAGAAPATARPLAPAPDKPLEPDHLRLGVWLTSPAAPLQAEVAEALRRACGGLSSAGVELVEVEPPVDQQHLVEVAWRCVNAEISRGLGPGGWEAARDNPASPYIQQVRDHLADQETALAAAAAWNSVLEGLDGLICPAVPVVAPEHHDALPESALGAWSVLTSGPQLPSVTLPVAFGARSGLPVGAQLVGVPGGDRRLLSAAAALESVLGPWPSPPGS